MKQLDPDLMFYVILLHQIGFTWNTPNPFPAQISWKSEIPHRPWVSTVNRTLARPYVL